MRKSKITHDFACILKSFDKCLAVINSCRTFSHLEAAKKMINNFFKLFPNSKSNTLSLYLKKRREVITEYGQVLEGTTVMSISNEDEPIKKGVVTRFTDFDKPSQSYIPLVKMEDGKEYLCFSIVMPFDEKLRDELMQIEYRDRWKKAAEINKQNRVNSFLEYLSGGNSPLSE